jgi:hypothetical protein
LFECAEVTTRRGKGLCDVFVERRGGHVERVRNLVQIMDNDCAVFEGHEGNLPYFSICSLLDRMMARLRA